MDVDRQLIFDVQRRVNASNVQHVKLWLFCYQLSKPNTAGRRFYERLLRHFAYKAASSEESCQNSSSPIPSERLVR